MKKLISLPKKTTRVYTHIYTHTMKNKNENTKEKQTNTK